MVEPIEWLREPELSEPVLVAAFSGWGDASDAATGAVRWLISHWQGEKIAAIRPDDFFDFTVARPRVRLESGGQRSIRWPTIDVFSAHPESGPNFVLLYGREPHLHWPDFTAALLDMARRCGVVKAVTLGAFFGSVLHTAPVPLTGFAGDEQLMRNLTDTGATPSNYEGQTGIASVLHDAFHSAGMPSMSLWAAVPFYLGSLKPNPRATYALLAGLCRMLPLEVDLERLRQAAEYFDTQIERQVSESKELRDLIARLEEQPPGSGGTPESSETPSELPSADVIIRDLEAFLKSNQPGQGPEAPSSS